MMMMMVVVVVVVMMVMNLEVDGSVSVLVKNPEQLVQVLLPSCPLQKSSKSPIISVLTSIITTTSISLTSIIIMIDTNHTIPLASQQRT